MRTAIFKRLNKPGFWLFFSGKATFPHAKVSMWKSGAAAGDRAQRAENGETAKNAGMIDSGRIEAMVAQLNSAAARAQGGVIPLEAGMGSGMSHAVAIPGFADALNASLDQVIATQNE